MSFAVIDSDDNVRRVTPGTAPDEVFSEDDAKDAGKLSRLLTRILKDIATLKRVWQPKTIEFEDQSVDATGTTKYRLEHGFGGRVRWWVTEWTGTAAHCLSKHADTDTTTLVLVSYVAGTATIRVEQAG